MKWNALIILMACEDIVQALNGFKRYQSSEKCLLPINNVKTFNSITLLNIPVKTYEILGLETPKT